MKIKILNIVLGICLSVGLVQADKLKQIRQSGTIKVGVVNDYEPFGFVSRTGKIIGVDIDLLNFIAKQLKIKLQLIPIDPKNYITLINTNQVDIVAAALTHTRRADKKVDFTIAYFYDGQSILGPYNSNATSFKNYENKTVGVIKGSTAQKVFGVIQPLAKLVEFDNRNDMVDALAAGKLDAATGDSAFLFKKAQKSRGTLKMIGKPFILKPYAIALKENESNLRDELNFAIQQYVKSGEYQQNYKKWFPKRILKRNPTLWPY